MPAPLGLYVHIPWCVRKCPYCDFNSHETTSIPEEAYVERLLQDLHGEYERVGDRPLTSIFFGGGTPSLFSPRSIGVLIEDAASRYGLSQDIEITLEANPGTADATNFAGYREAGVNRLSIGVQSFSDENLSALGRIHSGEQARLAIGMARDSGFDNLNLDLMHGLPGQETADAMDDLELAIALGAEHISWYQLTIEPNTGFYSKPPTLPCESALEDIEEYGHDRLLSAGYYQYEVSAYGHGTHRGQHNLNYWRFGDYLGIGAGAHGKITHSTDGRQERYWRRRQPDQYLDLNKPSQAGSRWLQASELIEEFLMNALRLRQGFTLTSFHAATGLDKSLLEPRLRGAFDRGLLVWKADQVACTDLGWRFLDSVLREVIAEEV